MLISATGSGKDYNGRSGLRLGMTEAYSPFFKTKQGGQDAGPGEEDGDSVDLHWREQTPL